MGSQQDEELDARMWAPCRGLLPSEPGGPSGTLAARLVQKAALEALQSMQEDGAQHAEEVAKLLVEGSLVVAQEALKTLCMMAPASPRNAYKRCETSPMAGLNADHASQVSAFLS
mmetsp:Transcript_91061/g.256645  ORF Transcript_91061/g.256645 Transcript_91061/m.256645 type:complete len:115 (-) Transcript_91061:67-411(-)